MPRNAMMPMMLLYTDVPKNKPRLIGEVGAYCVYATPYTLRDALMDCEVIQPIDSPTPGAGVGFVSLTPRLFQAGKEVVALLVDEEEAIEAEVLYVARAVYGDVQPIASP